MATSNTVEMLDDQVTSIKNQLKENIIECSKMLDVAPIEVSEKVEIREILDTYYPRVIREFEDHEELF